MGLTLCTSSLSAQTTSPNSPWTVTIVPAMNPLPIGLCGAVRLTLLDPSTKDRARNPQGMAVSIADFDMSVTGAGPANVAGEQNGPTNWSACACQAATAGSTVTVTASYPIKSAPRGLPTAVAPTTPAAPPAAPTLARGTSGAPLSAPTPAMAAAMAKLGTVRSGLAGVAPFIASFATTATGVRLVVVDSMCWDTRQRCELYRKDGAQLSKLTGTQRVWDECNALTWDDVIPSPSTYVYTVRAINTDATTIDSRSATWVFPALKNPTGSSAQAAAGGNVGFVWKPVANAVRYRLVGPGSPAAGLVLMDTTALVNDARRQRHRCSVRGAHAVLHLHRQGCDGDALPGIRPQLRRHGVHWSGRGPERWHHLRLGRPEAAAAQLSCLSWR